MLSWRLLAIAGLGIWWWNERREDFGLVAECACIKLCERCVSIVYLKDSTRNRRCLGGGLSFVLMLSEFRSISLVISSSSLQGRCIAIPERYGEET